MKTPRKEHGTVYLQNRVYALGGYNSTSKQMLDSVEYYDFEKE